MTELILYNLLHGFAFGLILYFTGYVVPLVQSLTSWK